MATIRTDDLLERDRELGELRDLRFLAQRELKRAAHYVSGPKAADAAFSVEDSGQLVLAPASGAANGAANEAASPTAQARQMWILTQIDAGQTLRTPQVQEGLGVSRTTAQRLLSGMVASGLITFAGPRKTGTYVRTSSTNVQAP